MGEEEKVTGASPARITYTTEELGALLGVSRDTIYRMVREKQIRTLAIQKHPFIFTKVEVDRVLRDMMSKEYWKEE